MPHPVLRRFVLLALVTVSLLSACGDDGGTDLDGAGTDTLAEDTQGEVVETGDAAETGDIAETGDTAEPDPNPFEELFGIYEITTWTLNETDCGAEGPSVIDTITEPYVVLSILIAFSEEIPRSKACTGLEECRVEAAGDSFAMGPAGVTHLWGEDPDGDGWESSLTTASGEDGQPCDFGVWLNHLTAPAPGTLRFENTFHEVAGIPRTAEGECDHDAAVLAAETAPSCSNYEVITATFVEAP